MGWSPGVWKGAVGCPTCRQLIKEPAILSVYSWKEVRSVYLPTLPCKTQSFTSLSSLLYCLLEILQLCGCFVVSSGDPISVSCQILFPMVWFFFITVKKYLLTSATASRQKVVCFTLKERTLFDSTLLAKKCLLPKGTNLSNCQKM